MMDTEPNTAPAIVTHEEENVAVFENSTSDEAVSSKPSEPEEPPPNKQPDDKNCQDTETEINLSEVKEQMLKEVEEMKDSDLSQLEVSPVVTPVEIEKLLEPKQNTTASKSNEVDETFYDTNPQVNIEDMKAGLDELRELDILVCGGCHSVFHFVEEFNKHKPNCRRKSIFHGNIAETKPQVWAFLLWKNAQTKINKQGIPVEESAWKLYQKWCKMPERIRNVWVAAGETVMNFSNFGFNKTVENSLKHLRKSEKGDSVDISEDDERKPVVMRKLVHRDHTGEIKEIRPSAAIIKKKYDEIENIRNQLEDGDSSQDKDLEMECLENGQPRIGFTKMRKVKTKDGESSFQEEEFVVEKIVSRRFNPRKKQYEYLLKWEGYPSEQNTWEPAENLEACQHLLKAFEENLSKQTLNKSKPLPRKNEHGMNQAGPSGLNSFGRPIRYSKQKALNQVKQWCGSIKPDDTELESLKRRIPGSDSEDDDDPYLKRIKLEKETDSEDSLGGRIVYTKNGTSGIIKRPGRGRPPSSSRSRVANGASGDNLAVALGLESDGDDAETPKKSPLELLRKPLVKSTTSTLSPANQQVLVANAKGVVKVDPAQVPNLSSGVYIMSNKSGIIKLDSVSPSKALSLKQGVPVKEVQQNALPASTPKQSPGSGSVVMVRHQAGVPPRSGVMRKNQVPGSNVSTPARPQVAASPQNFIRGPGRPPRPQSNIRINHPNTRLIHSGGSSRSNITINHPGRPRLPVKQENDMERRVLGPKINNTTRGGFNRGGYRGGRGGILSRAISSEMEINRNKNNAENDMPDFTQPPSPASDLGEPDDFPIDLPPLEPDSPPRPLTLCPETGKVLLKAEGEKTPEPTPPASPSPPPAPPAPSLKQESSIIKSEIVEKSLLSKENVKSQEDIAAPKEALIKKTLKPGSMGSVMVSPKKILPDIEEDNDGDDLVTITGDDGMVYKVSRAELNQTLMAQQGEDGQVTVYIQGEDGDAVLTLDPSSFEDDPSATSADSFVQPFRQVAANSGASAVATTEMYVKEAEESGQMVVGLQDGEGDDGQVVAQLVEAGEPAPGGGPRRVVLLLPDGNLMVTEVDEEQYAALELDKIRSSDAP